MAADYFLPLRRIYTVGVYSIKDDDPLMQENKNKILKREKITPIYVKMIGGR